MFATYFSINEDPRGNTRAVWSCWKVDKELFKWDVLEIDLMAAFPSNRLAVCHWVGVRQECSEWWNTAWHCLIIHRLFIWCLDWSWQQKYCAAVVKITATTSVDCENMMKSVSPLRPLKSMSMFHLIDQLWQNGKTSSNLPHNTVCQMLEFIQPDTRVHLNI